MQSIDETIAKKYESMYVLTLILHSAHVMKQQKHRRHQVCFAIKFGLNGLLDVARQTLLDTEETIEATFLEYQQKYPEWKLKLHYRYITCALLLCLICCVV